MAYLSCSTGRTHFARTKITKMVAYLSCSAGRTQLGSNFVWDGLVKMISSLRCGKILKKKKFVDNNFYWEGPQLITLSLPTRVDSDWGFGWAVPIGCCLIPKNPWDIIISQIFSTHHPKTCQSPKTHSKSSSLKWDYYLFSVGTVVVKIWASHNKPECQW